MLIGFCGGFLGGFLGQSLFQSMGEQLWCLILGWVLTGVLIGASLGVFDVLRGMLSKQESGAPLRKTINGMVGGFVGGLVGGLPYGSLMNNPNLPRSNLAIGLVILGICIGLFVGLAQVMLKEAWIKVEQGFRPGREMMLSKDETTIGRAEACDIGLFGDNQIERMHARILVQDNRYVLADSGTPGGTYLNDQRIGGPTPLRSGDLIRVGRNVLRFGERQKR
jgi:MFS family permease